MIKSNLKKLHIWKRRVRRIASVYHADKSPYFIIFRAPFQCHMCDQIFLGNAINQEHLQLCSLRTFDALIFWAAANHCRFPRFKMSCCTWASFKTLVFVGMLTAKFWAYLNPQSEPQFYNRFLKKLSQCFFLESSRRSAWINQCWCTLLTSLLRKKKKSFRKTKPRRARIL